MFDARPCLTHSDHSDSDELMSGSHSIHSESHLRTDDISQSWVLVGFTDWIALGCVGSVLLDILRVGSIWKAASFFQHRSSEIISKLY